MEFTKLRHCFSKWIVFGFVFVLSSPVESQYHSATSKPAMNLKSNSFKHNEFIPSKYTCDGVNVSPQLEWSDFPTSTKCFALICNDPDAPSGNWVHWVIANIPVAIHSFNEHVLFSGNDTNAIVSGTNDFGSNDYRGPCPPGGIHHYYFRIYALDSILKIRKGITADELIKNMQGHILSEGLLIGKYSRR